MTVGEMRMVVWNRDKGCVAPRLDPDGTPCYDRWGKVYPPRGQRPDTVEMDYVRLGAHGGRHVLARDHVIVCPGHHRGAGPSGGYQWATSHRGLLRTYLEEQHGEA